MRFLLAPLHRCCDTSDNFKLWRRRRSAAHCARSAGSCQTTTPTWSDFCSRCLYTLPRLVCRRIALPVLSSSAPLGPLDLVQVRGFSRAPTAYASDDFASLLDVSCPSRSRMPFVACWKCTLARRSSAQAWSSTCGLFHPAGATTVITVRQRPMSDMPSSFLQS